MNQAQRRPIQRKTQSKWWRETKRSLFVPREIVAALVGRLEEVDLALAWLLVKALAAVLTADGAVLEVDVQEELVDHWAVFHPVECAAHDWLQLVASLARVVRELFAHVLVEEHQLCRLLHGRLVLGDGGGGGGGRDGATGGKQRVGVGLGGDDGRRIGDAVARRVGGRSGNIPRVGSVLVGRWRGRSNEVYKVAVGGNERTRGGRSELIPVRVRAPGQKGAVAHRGAETEVGIRLPALQMPVELPQVVLWDADDLALRGRIVHRVVWFCPSRVQVLLLLPPVVAKLLLLYLLLYVLYLLRLCVHPLWEGRVRVVTTCEKVE